MPSPRKRVQVLLTDETISQLEKIDGKSMSSICSDLIERSLTGDHNKVFELRHEVEELKRQVEEREKQNTRLRKALEALLEPI